MTKVISMYFIALLGLGGMACQKDNGTSPVGVHGEVTFELKEEQLPDGLVADNTMDAEVGDLDGDGDLDLVLALEVKANLILLNDGNGNFSIRNLPQKNYDSEDIALADLDGDKDLDIVFVSEDLGGVNELYLNDGKANFTDASDRLPVEGVSNAVAAADLDGDQDIDLLIGNAGQNELLLNDGTAHFSQATERLPQVMDVTQDIEIGDVEGDGDLDILLGNEDDNRLWLNDGGGNFEEAAAEALPLVTGEETREADFGDIDGDGDLDIVFANVIMMQGTYDQNRILINDGTGKFTDETEQRLPLESTPTIDADFSDIDADGDLDLLTANFQQYTVYLNDGQGTFELAANLLPQSGKLGDGIDIEFADFNGDGHKDLYFANFQGLDRLLFQRK